MIEKFSSVKETISKVYRDLRLQDEDRWMDMVEWSAEALEQIGAYMQYVSKTTELEVESYRAAIPCDMHKVQGMHVQMEALQYNAGTFDTAENAKENTNVRTTSHSGYTMNDAWFNFNFEKGKVKLSYIATPTDDEGFPMIPDNVSYKEAIEKYIVMKLRYADFVMEKINPNTWDRIVNDWHWYCAQARGKANMPNADKMESIKNSWNRLKPEMNQHRSHFANLSNRERITK
jgi:hypothetical protein